DRTERMLLLEVAIGPARTRAVIEEVLDRALLLEERPQRLEALADRRRQARGEFGVAGRLTFLRKGDLGDGARLFGSACLCAGLRHGHRGGVGVGGEFLRRLSSQLMNAGISDTTMIPTMIMSSRFVMPGKILPSV